MQEDPLERLDIQRKSPEELLQYLKREPKQPEGDFSDIKKQVCPTCKYCGSVISVNEDKDVICPDCDKILSKEEIVKPDMDEETAVELETIARKGARLFLNAANKSDKVWKHLMSFRAQGDEEWKKMMKAMGKHTKQLAEQLNELEIPPWMTGWCVATARFLFEKLDKLK